MNGRTYEQIAEENSKKLLPEMGVALAEQIKRSMENICMPKFVLTAEYKFTQPQLAYFRSLPDGRLDRVEEHFKEACEALEVDTSLFRMESVELTDTSVTLAILSKNLLSGEEDSDGKYNVDEKEYFVVAGPEHVKKVLKRQGKKKRMFSDMMKAVMIGSMLDSDAEPMDNSDSD